MSDHEARISKIELVLSKALPAISGTLVTLQTDQQGIIQALANLTTLQSTIVGKLEGLGEDVADLRRGTEEIKERIDNLDKKVDDLADSIAKTNNLIQGHIQNHPRY